MLRPRWLLGTALALVVLARPAPGYDLTRSRDWVESPSGEDWFWLGWMLHHEQNYRAAIDAFARAIDAQYREAVAMYNIACGYAREGDPRRAFEWLERSLSAGLVEPEMLDGDADLRSLHSDPRWRDLTARANALAERRREQGQTRRISLRPSSN